MRALKAEDHRRRALERPYPLSIQCLSFEDMPGLGAGEIKFSDGPSVICGGNGVGKTTILRAIHLILSGEHGALPSYSLGPLLGSTLRCRISVDGEDKLYEGRVTESGLERDGEVPSLRVGLLDPGSQCTQWLAELRGMANVRELLDAVEPARSNARELVEISYLVGKEYRARHLYELGDEEDSLPYITVESGGKSYSVEDMGLGELVLNTLHWQLDHLPRRGIVLIEEPETFISPRSQRCLVDVLCRVAVEREVLPIITTHSYGIAGRLPRERTILVHPGMREDDSIGIIRQPAVDQLNDVLGLPSYRSTIVLVEDRVAELFAKSILDRTDPSLLGSVQFTVVAGETEITEILEHLPRVPATSLVGLYDADVASLPQGVPWPVMRLPGRRAPEGELRAALDAHTTEGATAISRPLEVVAAASAALRGIDDHDWMLDLADRLNKELPSLIDGLSATWLEPEANREAASQLAVSLRDAVRMAEAVD